MHPNSLHLEYGRGGGGFGELEWIAQRLKGKNRQQSKERGEMIITSLSVCAELLGGTMLLEIMDTLFTSVFITGYFAFTVRVIKIKQKDFTSSVM